MLDAASLADRRRGAGVAGLGRVLARGHQDDEERGRRKSPREAVPLVASLSAFEVCAVVPGRSRAMGRGDHCAVPPRSVAATPAGADGNAGAPATVRRSVRGALRRLRSVGAPVSRGAFLERAARRRPSRSKRRRTASRARASTRRAPGRSRMREALSAACLLALSTACVSEYHPDYDPETSYSYVQNVVLSPPPQVLAPIVYWGRAKRGCACACADGGRRREASRGVSRHGGEARGGARPRDAGATAASLSGAARLRRRRRRAVGHPSLPSPRPKT